MNLYRKLPVLVEAVQWSGSNWHEVLAFAGKHVFTTGGDLFVHTLEGSLRASPQDYIIKGIKGEFYPCKSDIFESTYEPVEDEHNS